MNRDESLFFVTGCQAYVTNTENVRYRASFRGADLQVLIRTNLPGLFIYKVSQAPLEVGTRAPLLVSLPSCLISEASAVHYYVISELVMGYSFLVISVQMDGDSLASHVVFCRLRCNCWQIWQKVGSPGQQAYPCVMGRFCKL